MNVLPAAIAEGALNAFLTDIGTFFSQAMDWMGTVLTKVTDSPALLVLVLAMPICGFAVGLLSRLIRM